MANSRRFDLAEMSSIAYWAFVQLKKCMFSGAYPNYIQNKPTEIQKLSKPQIVGEVYHDCMEKIVASSEFDSNLNIETFNGKFNQIISGYKNKISSNVGNTRLAGIDNWPEITKVYYCTLNALKSKTGGNETGRNFTPEIKLKSKDNILVGKLDALIKSPSGYEVIDYKSGSIWNDSVLKEEYVAQLHFYAHLVEQNYGEFPEKLTLIELSGAKESFQPSPAISNSLASDARRMRDLVNERKGKNAQEFASPSEANCKWCHVKPYCEKFWSSVSGFKVGTFNHSLKGTQTSEIRKSRNGTASFNMEVIQGTSSLRKIVKIARVGVDEYPGLSNKIGQMLTITDLKSVGPNTNIFEVTPSTRIVTEADHV